MNNTLKVGGIVCLGVALFATLSSVEQNSTETAQVQYVQNPPIAKNYWVQKIRTPQGVQGGEYSVVLKAEFEHDLPLPEVLNIYKNGEVAQILQDDGNYPDDRANDGIFATIVNQDPDEFVNQIKERLDNIQVKGYAMDFVGHSGSIVKYSDIKKFNVLSFQNFEIQEFDEVLIEEGSPCSMDENIIAKEKSLFITDRRVVENGARTYNVVTSQGTAQGAWTFGELMKNMAGGFADESDPDNSVEIPEVRNFIKNWIIQLYTEYSINNRTSPEIATHQVRKHIIEPWIIRARMDLNQTPPTIGTTDMEDWKSKWDEFTSDAEIHALLANAPFKLSAIVNRVDLRGNSGYYSGNNAPSDDLINGGETRFIFSLVQTLEDQGADNGLDNLGLPPWNHDTGYGPNAARKIDWRGMNVILEFANVTSSGCDVKSIGQQWKDLSTYDIHNTNTTVADAALGNYLTALQNITDLVTTRNANPNGVNGSAISQVRTNSKLFAVGNTIQDFWNITNWELREFGLDENGALVSQPTANMPFADNNTRRNSLYHPFGYDNSPDQSSQDITDWIYGVNGPSKQISVRNGNHNIPQHLLEPVSELKDELQSHYALGFWHSSFPNNIYDDHNYNSQASAKQKDIRHQLSLNTCMGCHGGDTKTVFAMIQPLGYGEEANYWSSTPSTRTGKIDHGDQTSNLGYTLDPDHPDEVGGFVPNHEQEYYSGTTVHEQRTIPIVSPFLTGRNFRGLGLGVETAWDDDKETQGEPDDLLGDPLNDNKITGLFYVNDPTNEASMDHNGYTPASHINDNDTPFPQIHTKRYGFNELENRQLDLCLLTSTSCHSGGVFDILAGIDFVPLPFHGH